MTNGILLHFLDFDVCILKYKQGDKIKRPPGKGFGDRNANY